MCRSWNIKAYVIDQLLSEGKSEVWWIDSDIIVNGNFLKSYATEQSGAIIACEEAIYGRYRDDGFRANAWGLSVGRTFMCTLNTGVLRMDQTHKKILLQWKSLLETDEYMQSQTLPTMDRPIHMLGDQDALTAILTSSSFSQVPVRILRRGSDIIQYFGPPGFTMKERLRCLCLGLPNFIHAQGRKPWSVQSDEKLPMLSKLYIHNLMLQLSPYLFVARQYKEEIDQNIPWLYPRCKVAKLLYYLSFGNPAIAGAPISAVVGIIRNLRSLKTKIFKV